MSYQKLFRESINNKVLNVVNEKVSYTDKIALKDTIICMKRI
jgi:hypothetical protein